MARDGSIRRLGALALGLTLVLAAPPATGATGPACADGNDNDLDELVDFPDDPGCHAANDDDESDPAGATGIESRLLIAVASSGSLNGNVCAGGTFTGGDGSSECAGADVSCAACASPRCGDSLANDSRLFEIRAGLGLLASRGDVELALLRATQSPVAFTCPSSSSLSASGGWQGAAAACDGGLDGGELLVGFAAGNLPELAAYLDGDDDWNEAGTAPAGLDFELRGSGDRPLGGLLVDASGYLESTRASDLFAACRPYRLILLADGGESCAGDAVAAADALFDAGVPVHVIGFAVHDSETIAELNDVAIAGGTSAGLYVDNGDVLAAALDSIAAESVLVESCNGLDDDCDGLYDEDFPHLGEACDDGLQGACYGTGSLICGFSADRVECQITTPGAVATPELCNGIDDDCDGQTDEGGVCQPASELCNGVDDDGNEGIDEGFPVGAACATGTGACRATGIFACRDDHLGVICVPTVAPPAPALFDTTCDGVDDDCDGSSTRTQSTRWWRREAAPSSIATKLRAPTPATSPRAGSAIAPARRRMSCRGAE